MSKIHPRAIDEVIDHISGGDVPVTSSGQKDKDVLLSETLLVRYDTDDRKTWIKQAIEDDGFANNIMWKDKHVADLEKLGYAAIKVPIIPELVDYSVGMLTFKNPAFSATAREDSDVEEASFAADLMAWIVYNSGGNNEIKRFAYDAFVRSMGGMIVYPDFNEKEVFIKAFNTLDLFLPPSCKNRFAADADHQLLRTYETERQLGMRYPEIDFPKLRQSGDIVRALIDQNTTDRNAQEGQVMDDPDSDPDTIIYEILDRYTKVKVESHFIWHEETAFEETLEGEDYEAFKQSEAVLLHNLEAGSLEVVLEEEDIAYYKQLAEDGVFHLVQDPETNQPQPVPGQEDEFSIPGSTVAVGLVTMGDLIEKGFLVDEIKYVVNIQRVESAGGYLTYKGLIPISRYPIVTWMMQHNRNPYPISKVRMGKSLNEYINKTRQQIAAHTANSVGQTVLLNAGTGVDPNELQAKLSAAGTKVITIPADEDIRKSVLQLQTPPLSNQLFADINMAKQELRDIFGVYQFMQGDASQAPSTKGATLALDEFGQRKSKFLLDDFYNALGLIGQVAMEYAQYVYTEHKVIRLFQPNNKPKVIEINEPVFDQLSGELIRRINDVSLTKVDIIVVPQSTMPSNRWAKLEYMLMLWKERILTDNEPILRMSDLDNVDDVIANQSIIAQLKQALQSSQEQNEKIGGQLQTTQRELLHALRRVELGKFKEDLTEDRADLKVSSKEQELAFESLIRDLKTQVQA